MLVVQKNDDAVKSRLKVKMRVNGWLKRDHLLKEKLGSLHLS